MSAVQPAKKRSDARLLTEGASSGKGILIAESCRATCDLICSFLKCMRKEVDILAVTDNGHRAVELAIQHQPHIVVMSLATKHLNGFEVVYCLREKGFAGAFLLFTENQPFFTLQRIQAAQFDGVVLKDSPINVLQEAIRKLLRGGNYHDPLFIKALADAINAPNSPLQLLSKREAEVLAQIGLAKTNDAIAKLFGISAKTVQRFRSSLLHKLDLIDTPSLVSFAREHGYTSFPLTSHPKG